jgi:calpain-15
VDDYFPCRSINSSVPIFSKAHGDELWVLLMEKAYAKIYGSYATIEGGDPAHALRDLTGAPYESLDDCPDLDKLWDFIHSAEKNGNCIFPLFINL